MELGEVIRVTLPAFYVVGKEGKGLAEEGPSWVPALWDLATKDFEEIEFLLADQEAENLQFWGLMSDGENWLDHGKRQDVTLRVSKSLRIIFHQ